MVGTFNVQESSLRPTDRSSLLPVLARPPIRDCIETALELLNRSSGQVSVWRYQPACKTCV